MNVAADGRLIQADVLEEAVRLLAAAEKAGLQMRALGGMAIVLRTGERLHPSFRREIRDIDVATQKGQARKATDFLTAQGYAANRTFNAVHGSRRLLFYDQPNARQIDVFVGSFEMCHELPLAERLALESLTLPLAELVMTKLQIVKLNQKDEYDLYSLFLAHEVADHDDDTINAPHIADLCAKDWGLYRTFQLNLARLRNDLDAPELTEGERRTIHDRIRQLEDTIEEAPKTAKWKMRARVGDRVRWYEDPEEVELGSL